MRRSVVHLFLVMRMIYLLAIYLIVHWSLKCDKIGSEYTVILDQIWAEFAIWLRVPFMFLSLLISIRVLVRSRQIQVLVKGCRFIWGDYKESMILWEFVDII